MITKLAGAKNVLLLIVLAVKEITIDGIGEIKNDHIQGEAGQGAQHYYGVGEEKTLLERGLFRRLPSSPYGFKT